METAPVEDKQRTALTEDVWAVIIGSVLIGGVLAAAMLLPGQKLSSPAYQWADAAGLATNVFAAANLSFLAGIGIVFAVLASVAVHFIGGNIKKFLPGFIVLYALSLLAFIAAGNKGVNNYGIEYVIFALLFGLALNNFFNLPCWLKSAARSEFFIKTGLVILGSSVLFTDIVKAGFPGLLQAVVVVAAVWMFAIWLSRKLKVDDEFAVILASAVSICGVSAAIVAAGAIGGDKKKLSYVTTLVLLVAIPMLLLQPWIIRHFHIPELVGGAWLGGTLDTTASVTAASELVGPLAVKVGVIIKFAQNVLIGFAAFFIAWWWIVTKKKTGASSEKPSLRLVWARFPKFVIGLSSYRSFFRLSFPLLSRSRQADCSTAFVRFGLRWPLYPSALKQNLRIW